MSHPELSILIPAAGASERLGQAKQLVEYRGRSLIQNAVTSAVSINPFEVIVVTGAKATAVKNPEQTPPVPW
jgi:CTP:molybdopterin cytidylyltransferase MocA